MCEYSLAVYQGVWVLSLTTVQEVRFAGLATLRAQSVNAGLIFTNTLNGGQEIEKIYRPSRMAVG